MQDFSQISTTVAVVTLTGAAIMTMIIQRMMYFDGETRQTLDEMGMVLVLIALIIATLS